MHVEREGRPLARLVAGRIQPDDPQPLHEGVRFRLASLTKPVVTLAALMLVDEGRLDLDAPVAEVLPVLGGLRLPGGRAPRAAPTVRDLMRHTAGLAYPYEVADPAVRDAWTQGGVAPGSGGQDSADFLQRLSRMPLAAEPATRFQYGYSTDVLGCVIEQLDGLPLGQALRRRLFDPLGMRHTSFDVLPDEPTPLAHAEDKAWACDGDGHRPGASLAWCAWTAVAVA